MIRPGAIGDTIVSFPALQFLAASAQYCEVWVNGPTVPLIRFADRVRSIASTGLDFAELRLPTPVWSLLESFDSVVSWYGASRQEFRNAVAHLPFRFHSALPGEGTLHATDFYLRQVGSEPGAIPQVPVDKTARGSFVAIHPFSGSPRKNWDLRRFEELAGVLAPVPVRFLAGPDEVLPGAARFETLAEVAEWLASARCYVGNDSGISHLAAAVGTPTLALFRCTDPKVWAPRSTAPARVIVGDPEVDEVYRAVMDLIA